MYQNNSYLANSFATAGKTLVPNIGKKGLFLQVVTFQIFFSLQLLNASQPFWFIGLGQRSSWRSVVAFFAPPFYGFSSLYLAFRTLL